MNIFERGMGPGEIVKSVEPSAERGAELVKYFQSEEKKEISPIGCEGEKTSRLKKAILATTAGLMLFSAIPAFAQGNEVKKISERQKIEAQIKNLQSQEAELEQQEHKIHHQERMAEMNSYLGYFNVDGLEVGEPEVKLRGIMEQVGIYIKGRHIEDIYATGSLEFSRVSFLSKVKEILDQIGVRFEIKSEVQFEISPEAKEKLREWGGYIDSETLTMKIGGPNTRMSIDSNTKAIGAGIIGHELVIVVTDYDGSLTTLTCEDGKIKNISNQTKNN